MSIACNVAMSGNVPPRMASGAGSVTASVGGTSSRMMLGACASPRQTLRTCEARFDSLGLGGWCASSNVQVLGQPPPVATNGANRGLSGPKRQSGQSPSPPCRSSSVALPVPISLGPMQGGASIAVPMSPKPETGGCMNSSAQFFGQPPIVVANGASTRGKLGPARRSKSQPRQSSSVSLPVAVKLGSPKQIETSIDVPLSPSVPVRSRSNDAMIPEIPNMSPLPTWYCVPGRQTAQPQLQTLPTSTAQMSQSPSVPQYEFESPRPGIGWCNGGVQCFGKPPLAVANGADILGLPGPRRRSMSPQVYPQRQRGLAAPSSTDAGLDAVLVNAKAQSKTSLCIWFHFLGGEGANWETGLKAKIADQLPWVAWYFPDAPKRPVTTSLLNSNGTIERCWFDQLDYQVFEGMPTPGLEASVSMVHALLRQAEDCGFSSNRIFLGGMSQGGVLAMTAGFSYDKLLAGIIAIAAWIPPCLLGVMRQPSTPLMIGNGDRDHVVPMNILQNSVRQLEQAGCNQMTKNIYPRKGHYWHDYACRDVQRFMQVVSSASGIPKVGCSYMSTSRPSSILNCLGVAML